MIHKVHILAIDDIELGCAGTLISHARKGQAIAIVDLTEGELGTRGSVPDRYNEAAAAAKIMGVAHRDNLQIRDGFFRNDEEHQLKLISYIRKYRPEIVIANAPADRHPDHGRGCRLTTDACFLSGLRKIVTYDATGNPQEAWRPKRVFSMIQDRQLEPTFIVDISSTFETKMEAIRAYSSQFYQPGSEEPLTYISTQNFTEQIRYRDALMGKKIGTAFGEGFISENIPGLSDLDSLLYPEMA
jgi:bacillithiol biosynthesis deacetylase BshB1